MTRIVAIGDTHFQHGHRRNAARLNSMEQIIRAGEAMPDLGAWVHLGDVFHARSTADDRNAVAAFFQRMADRAPVVVQYGNHCSPLDLDIFAKLRAKFSVTVVARPQTVHLTLATGEPASAFCIPYPHKSGLVGAGVPHDQLGAAARSGLDAICLVGAADLAEARAAGRLTWMMAHGTIAGANSSVGQPMGLDGDIAFDAGILARFDGVPKLFGHIHAHQELHGAVYAGSIAPCDWGEAERKVFLVVEFDTGTYRVISCPLDVPQLWHVEGDLTRDGFTYQVKRGPDGEPLEAPASWAGAEVRVRYRFNAEDKAGLDVETVKAPFAGAALIELEPIAVRSRAIRSEEVATATTLTEKVAAVIRLSGGEWTPSLAAKLEALQQPEGVAFLNSAVQVPAPADEAVPV